MDNRADPGSFIDKWHARWPEWSLAMVFVPAAQRERVVPWFALLQELTDAAWGGSDPTPGLAKLAWWQDELLGWSKGARRHPLGAILQPLPAPWRDLAVSLPGLQATRARPAEPAQATDAGAEFAAAVAACEAVLFGASRDGGAAAAVAASLAVEHALWHPETAPVATAAAAAGATRPRSIHAALSVARLRRGRDAGALGPIRAVLVAWRAARRAG
jgi:phytoene/squalene synthetase